MSIERWLATGRVFREFPDQDSHCVSVGLEHEGRRWFVKRSAHSRGMASLRRAIALGSRAQHPILVPLHRALDLGDRVLLAYPFVEGEMVRPRPGDPDRFRALPLSERAAVVDAVFALHVQLADQGFVAVDLYDGCLLYDHEARRPWIFDLDEYRPGPFVLEEERNPGSKRLMAPEELVRGSRIDEQTNVFTLARLAMILLGDYAGTPASWAGPPQALELLQRATAAERERRPGSVRAFVAEYNAHR